MNTDSSKGPTKENRQNSFFFLHFSGPWKNRPEMASHGMNGACKPGSTAKRILDRNRAVFGSPARRVIVRWTLNSSSSTQSHCKSQYLIVVRSLKVFVAADECRTTR